jgi:hypothetical protein
VTRLAAAAVVALAGAALPVQGARASEPPPGDAGPASAREQGDEVARLSTLVRETSPWEMDALVRGDPRFSALGPDDRRRLLALLEEPVKVWAPLLNLYPGYGIGSMAQGDRRGVWVAGVEGLATVGLLVGMIGAFADDFDATPEQRARSKRQSRAIVLTSLAVLGAARAVSIVLPFTFRGARHAAVDRALSREPPRVAVWVAPAQGPTEGVRAGLALRFGD